MPNSPPFRPDKAKDAIEGDGDFLLPICATKPGLLMGESLAAIVLTTVEGQRVNAPLGMQGLPTRTRTPARLYGRCRRGTKTAFSDEMLRHDVVPHLRAPPQLLATSLDEAVA